MPQVMKRPVRSQNLVRPAEHCPGRRIRQRPERAAQRPPHRISGTGRHQAMHLLLVKAQPHESVRRGRKLLDRPRPLADHRDQLLARVDPPGQHAKQLGCACTGRDPERQQRPVPVRAQRREQLIELAIRDLPWDPLGHPRPEQPGPLPAEPVHRVVMSMRPAGPGQREGVHQRSRAGLQVKVIKRPGHRLAVRDRSRGVLRPGRRLPRHPVRHRNPRTGSSEPPALPWTVIPLVSLVPGGT